MKQDLTIEEAKEILTRNNCAIGAADSDDVIILYAKIIRFYKGQRAAKEERQLQKAAEHLRRLKKHYSLELVEARYAEMQAHDANTPSSLNFIRNSSEAKEYRDMAIWLANHAMEDRKRVAERLEMKLMRLQTLRLEVWKQELAEFITVFGRIKNVERPEDLPDYKNIKIPDVAVLKSMEDCSLSAKNLLAGGVASLGSGAIAGLVAWNTAMALGTAGTGTAIAGLTGAAATHATLAFFGGGSIAAGGGGMALGAAVLTGFAAVPAIVVSSLLLIFVSKKNWHKAYQNFLSAYGFHEQCETEIELMAGIEALVDQVSEFTTDFRTRFRNDLKQLDHMTSYCGTDYLEFCTKSRLQTMRSILYADTMMKLIYLPVMTKEHTKNENAHQCLESIKGLISAGSDKGEDS